MAFQLWSELNTGAVTELRPDFGLRSWDDLSVDEKYKIWKYLDRHLFKSDIRRDYNDSQADDKGYFYAFTGTPDMQRPKRTNVYLTIMWLNDFYKAQTYAKRFLDAPCNNNACADFYSIFQEQSESVVMELLSIYAKGIIEERENKNPLYKAATESVEDFQERLEKWRWEIFEDFATDINEVFGQFGVNVYLTRLGFVAKQENRIEEEVFAPVLTVLSNPKWKEVNQLLSDAFQEYRKNSPTGFSNSVTNSVAAVQALLQILVNGKTGNGEISKLIPQAIAKNLIPDDAFTKEVFKTIESVLARERQETGVAHPKKEYATDMNARLVLNLAMVFFQHALQIK